MHAQERKRYPQLVEIAARVPSNSELTKEDFQGHLAELDKSLRSVPATAQVQPPSPLCSALEAPRAQKGARWSALSQVHLWQKHFTPASGHGWEMQNVEVCCLACVGGASGGPLSGKAVQKAPHLWLRCARIL